MSFQSPFSDWHRGWLRLLPVFSLAFHLFGCVSLERDLHGEEHLKLWNEKREKAFALYQQSDFTGAKATYQEAMDQCRYCPDPDQHLAISLRDMALVEMGQWKLKPAESNLRQAVDLYSQLRKGGNDKGHSDAQTVSRRRSLDTDYAKTLILLANNLRSQHDFTAAEPLYNEAIKINESVLAPLSEINRCRQDYARLLRMSGRGKDALRLEQQIVDSSVDYSDWDRNQTDGQTMFATGVNVVGGKERLKVALETAEKIGKDDWRYGVSLSWAGVVDESEGKLKQAKEKYLSSIPIIEKSLGPEDQHLLAPLAHLAKMLEKEGNKRDAISMVERAIKIMVQASGEKSAQVAALRKFHCQLQGNEPKHP